MSLPGEVWRVVPSFPKYEVSDKGRVRHAKTGRVRSPCKNRLGYFVVGMWSDGKNKNVQLHRMICEAFHGPQPAGKPIVAHWDGTRGNNIPDNLRWATYADNSQDRLKHHGITPRPKYLPRRRRTVLSANDVQVIRTAPRAYGIGRELAARYGVSLAHIHKIRSRALDVRPTVPWNRELPIAPQKC